MPELQGDRMQCLPSKTLNHRPPVKRVAELRMPSVGAVHANLMGPPGMELAMQ